MFWRDPTLCSAGNGGELVEYNKIEPCEAAAGFAALAVILAGEVLLILGANSHEVPLPRLAQMVSRVLFGH